MLDLNDDYFEDDIEFGKYETSPLHFESFQRQRPPFLPMPGSNGNIPPIGNYPPDFNSPAEKDFNPPAFNFPGGTFTPPGAPKSPPPNYIPSKNSVGVQSFSSIGGDIQTAAVSSNSIRFCIYKYTYIWQRNGRSYWIFLLNVDKRSISGFRWTGRYWIYFGIDLRQIDAFTCYRSTSEGYCEDCNRNY